MTRFRKFLAKKNLSMSRKIETGMVKLGLTVPWRKRIIADHTFTVVSAVYNMERYLDDYFSSLLRQVIDFRSSIQVIIVDDGSTDESIKICSKWRSLYPKNITIVSQDNAGQASARNLGMKHATGEWITFIDPDDFVSRRYFLGADRLLRQRRKREIALLAPKLIMYYEKNNNFADNHTLSYRFKDGTTIVPINNPGKYLQLSAATAFFRRDIIEKHGLDFDPRIRPAFEDAHFVGRYLLEAGDRDICFTDKAIYYYRKRQTQTSTIDTAWHKKERFDDQIRYGSIGLLEYAKTKHGFVPDWVQRMVLYDIAWHFRRVTNNSSATSFLSKKERRTYISLLRKTFSYISVENIVRFELTGIWSFHKIGICARFKGCDTDFNNLYCEEYDEAHNSLRLRLFSRRKRPKIEIFKDDKAAGRLDPKIVAHRYIDSDFVYETIFWVDVKDACQLSAIVDGKASTIIAKGTRSDSLSVRETVAALSNKDVKVPVKLVSRLKKWHASRQRMVDIYRDAWLISDREDKADDNGEHFYRYLMQREHRPNIFYVLKRSSSDWRRLEQEGFRLINFGSWWHHLAVINSKFIISSHAGRHIRTPLPIAKYKDVLRNRFVFLQHGVILHDVSPAINSINPKLMITSTVDEFKSIAGNFSAYKLSKREVKLTGLARHDALLSKAGKASKIVIMPTWRTSLLAQSLPGSSVRAPLSSFVNSEFASRWLDVLRSQELQRLAVEHSCEVVFVLHFMFDAYKKYFEGINGVTVLSQGDRIDIQTLFCEAKVLVTDYSSVAFEAAYLDREVVYYQFDFDEFFGSGHGYSFGYFDYEKNGFGPVCSSHDDLLLRIGSAVTGQDTGDYALRRRSTFPHRDGRNSERILQAIEDLG